MSYINNNNIKIYYETYGDKNSNEVILFLTGAGSDCRIWEKQVENLQNEFFLIIMDNRGSGKSDCPEYNYNLTMLCEDVDKILQAESIESLAIVGFSMGGLIAQKMWDLNTNANYRINKIVLMNCSLGSGNPDTVVPAQDVVNTFLFSSALIDEDIARNAIDYNFGKSLEKENPKLYKKYFNDVMLNVGGVQYQVPILVSSKALINDYANISIPVLGVFSKDDPVIPLENASVLKKYIPHAEIKILEGFHSSVSDASGYDK